MMSQKDEDVIKDVQQKVATIAGAKKLSLMEHNKKKNFYITECELNNRLFYYIYSDTTWQHYPENEKVVAQIRNGEETPIKLPPIIKKYLEEKKKVLEEKNKKEETGINDKSVATKSKRLSCKISTSSSDKTTDSKPKRNRVQDVSDRGRSGRATKGAHQNETRTKSRKDSKRSD